MSDYNTIQQGYAELNVVVKRIISFYEDQRNILAKDLAKKESQKYVADLLGCSREAVSKWLSPRKDRNVK